MERLTDRHFKKTDGFYMKCNGYCSKENLSCEDCIEFEKLVDRLGEIEEIMGDDYDLDRLRELVDADRNGRCTVLSTPKRIMVYETLEHDIDHGKLRELVEAYQEGRFVVLPAKTVFELTWDAGPGCDMVCPLTIDGESQCDFCDHGKMFVYERECKQEHIDQIGKTVFLTREAAEAALKGEQDE